MMATKRLSGKAEALCWPDQSRCSLAKWYGRGQLRPLIFFAPKRLPPPFADVPASTEFGYEILLPQVRAVLAKAGADPQRLHELGASIERITKSPEYVKFIEQQMALPDSFMAAQTAQTFLQSEFESSRKLLATYGAK
jgi:tripartite-type tricarboxylate transporter receptor subunit TctC